MSLAVGVGTLHLAQLAAVEKVDDAPGFRGGQAANIAVLLVDRIEERRKRRTQIEAQPASVADVVYALEFLIEAAPVPITELGGVVGEPIGGLRVDAIG